MPAIPNSQGFGLVQSEISQTPIATLDSDPIRRLGQIATETENTFKKIKANRDELESTRAISAAQKELQVSISDLEADKDYDTQFQRYQERAKELSETYGSQIKSKRARARFDSQFGEFAFNEGIKVRSKSLGNHLKEQRGIADLNIDQIASTTGNIVDPEQRKKARSEGFKEIQRNLDIGVYDELEAAEALVRFQGLNAKADVRRDIQIDPEDAILKLQNNEYRGLTAEQNQIWQERGIKAIESERRARLAAEDKAEKKLEGLDKERADAASLEGDLLLRKGNLTEQWIEANAEVLEEADRRYFYKKLDEGPVGEQASETYADLRLDATAGDVREDAREALRRGDISESQFDKLLSRSERNAPESSLPNPLKRAENLIRVALEPPANFTDPLQKIRQADAVDSLFEWFDKNKDASPELIQKRADEIITNYSLADTRKILRESQRKTGYPAPKNQKELEEQMADVVVRFNAGEITQDEAKRLAVELKNVELVIENE